jgi:outer membrane receptor protein involved in Fe transport
MASGPNRAAGLLLAESTQSFLFAGYRHMKSPSLSLSALLLATSALIAPGVFAQETQPADPPTTESTESEEVADAGDIIVVRGQFIPEPLQVTSEVAAFLSAEDLSRQGDSDAADALTKLPGLSVAEGRFVYVRGLGERYSSAILNGSPLPSPEPLQRVVPLDLFPASILSEVMVQKSYSVEFPGEFGGGVIQLGTLNLPDESFFEVGAGFSVNMETTFATGYTHDGGDSDIFGFDDGTRKIPNQLKEAILASRRVDATLDLYPQLTNAQELQRIGQSFENAKLNLVQLNTQIPANGSFDISTGLRQDFDNWSIGYIGVLGYSNGWETEDGIQQEGRIDGGVATPKSDYNFTSTDNKVGWDGLFGVGLELGSEHKIDWTNLWIRRTDKRTYRRFGFDELAGEQVLDERTAWYERTLSSTQLDGTHEFDQLEVSWRAAYSRTERDAPYERQMRFIFDDTIDRYLHDTSRATNRWEFSELVDEINSAGVTLKYSLALPIPDVREMELSAGIDWFDNTRSAASRAFRFIGENLPLEVQQSRPDFLFADFNVSPDRLVIRETTGSAGAAAYDAQLEVSAAFLKADFEPIPFFRVAIGGRFEEGKQSVSPRALFLGEAQPTQPPVKEEEYFLPAGTVTWNFLDDWQLRVGASQTIGRPQFRELAPQQYLDPDSDRLFIGNPFLVDTELTNFDTRLENFFGRNQFFTVGAFYKDIEKPIESVVAEQGATIQQTYLNAPKAILYGAEAEIRTTFTDPLPDVWWIGGKDIFLQSNYTWSQSEVQVSAGDIVFPLASGGAPLPAENFIIDGSRLQGQSEHVVNLQLGWEDPIATEQGTFILNYVSERSSARGRPGEPDLIQEPGVTLDFVYRREFDANGRPVTFSFKANNLTNEDYLEHQEFGGGEIIINNYDLGVEYSFGLSTRF